MSKKEKRTLLLVLLLVILVAIVVVIKNNNIGKEENVANQNLLIVNKEENISFEAQTLTAEDKKDITAHLGETITIDANTEK